MGQIKKSPAKVKIKTKARESENFSDLKSVFPIVGIGASAGGLDAISQLLSNLDEASGMAFIIVQHLDPNHESMTDEILRKKTSMPVTVAKQNSRVEPNHVYVIPPNVSLALQHGKLKLSPRVKEVGPHLPINFFFKSLAADQPNRAIAIILSGTATDGTEGLEFIKAAGGLTIAQTPASAKYDGMPQSAISSGYIDLVLAPEDIAKELARIARHPLLAHSLRHDEVKDSADEPPEIADEFLNILESIREQCHVDFTNYRKSTIRRRIERRMILRKKQTLKEYAEEVRENPEETKDLFADLLINVTEFFRDPKSIAALKSQIFPTFLKGKASKSPIRIWVVGCATGEEAYSVAISLREFLAQKTSQTQIQIFATDISDMAIRKARIGEYPESISQTVSNERLLRFFTKIEGGYRINKSIRDLCFFSRHDVTRDPPFAKLDLVCCRNVLIYFEPSLQKRVIPIFHYSLRPGGFLWLGKSESVGSLSALFTLVDKPKRFFARNQVATMPLFQFPARRLVAEKNNPPTQQTERRPQVASIQEVADHLALNDYVPPTVVVNREMEIILNRGDTSQFLQLPFGQTSLNLFKMARPEIVSELRMAIQAVKLKGKPVSRMELSLLTDQGTKFSLRVVPITFPPQSKTVYFSIFFESVRRGFPTGTTNDFSEVTGKPLKPRTESQKALTSEIRRLNRVLAETKAYQQTLVFDSDSVKEELTAANEEMQSTNEEFQSTNEELETAKEELQSSNEELTTVNDELQVRNTDLIQLNDDLINLLGTVDIPIVMVGIDGRIRRFTPKAGKLMNLIPGDIGRPIGNIKQNFNVPEFSDLISEVIENMKIQEFEVQDGSGHWFRLQIRPYKTGDNRIDGAVIALVDIDDLKRTLDERKNALEHATSIANTVQLPLVVLDNKLQFISANSAFYEKFLDWPIIVNRDFLSALGASADLKLRKELLSLIEFGNEVKQLEIEYELSARGYGTLVFNARRIKWVGIQADSLLLSIEDISERRQLERELKASEEKLKGLVIREQEARAESEKANHAKDEFLATLSHELRTPLTSILSWAQLIPMMKDTQKAEHGIRQIERSARLQGQLIDDLLDVSRIQSGKLSVNFTDVDIGEVIRLAADSVRHLAIEKNIKIESQVNLSSEIVSGDLVRLQQVVCNLLTNALKFSSSGQTVWIKVEPVIEDGRRLISIQVIDQGKGIKPEFLSKLFMRFSQADSSSIRIHGGLGLGLAIVSDLLRLQGGSVRAQSEGLDKGSTFTVLMPVKISSETPHHSKPTGPYKVRTESEAPNLNGLCVMIVEDEASTREVLKQTLSFFGATVFLCSSSAEAFDCIEAVNPDVLVSDIAMPGEDGNSFIRRIRKMESKKLSQIPALALTAYASSEDVQRTVSAGFNAHLTKPFDSFRLGREVAQLARSQVSTKT